MLWMTKIQSGKTDEEEKQKDKFSGPTANKYLAPTRTESLKMGE